MKKQYIQPQMECVNIEQESALLAASSTSENSISISDDVYDSSTDTQLSRPSGYSLWDSED